MTHHIFAFCQFETDNEVFFQSYVVSSQTHVQKICTLIPDIDWRMLENFMVAFYHRNLQLVENNLTNIGIFCTDIRFLSHGTMLMALIRMSVWGCSRMLDGLVSSHSEIYTSAAALGAPHYTLLLSNTVFSWKDLLGINTVLFVLSINGQLKGFTNIDTNLEQTITFSVSGSHKFKVLISALLSKNQHSDLKMLEIFFVTFYHWNPHECSCFLGHIFLHAPILNLKHCVQLKRLVRDEHWLICT
jgi:hypothetical protein